MKHGVQLATGHLQLRLERSSLPLQELCGFAARNNPKRGFLFVSKVLGKHWPSSTAQMQRAHRLLAAQIAPSLWAGAVVIGMAETATGLGHGLFEAGLEQADPGAGPALYLHSTRYPLAGAERLDFEEPHSHAAQQILYFPEHPELRAKLLSARSVILVDDEISTGQTLANLVQVLRASNPKLEHVVLACLTDFSEGAAERRLRAIPGILSVQTAALLHGAFAFERALDFQMPTATPAFATMDCRRAYLSEYSARLGLTAAVRLPERLIQDCLKLCADGGRNLLLGTGEFMHAAYCLARALETHGVDCTVQSTTRSPILVGADIATRLEVPDPYREGISNYLYNFQRSAYAQVFVVHETPRNAELRALCQTLAAHAVDLQQHVVHPAELAS